MNDLILIFSGCYKGQETISRLITYDGVKQRLWGIRLSAPTEPGSPITIDGKKVLVMTVMLLTLKNNPPKKFCSLICCVCSWERGRKRKRNFECQTKITNQQRKLINWFN